MFKIKLISAAALVAVCMCLSACGDSEASGPATPDTVLSETSAQETGTAPSAAGESVSASASENSSDTASSETKSGSSAVSRDGAGSDSGRAEDYPSGGSDSGNNTGCSGSGYDQPAETTAEYPQERDNAEVDFNDL